MAEKETTSGVTRTAGPELRLVDRRAFVGFPELKLSPGVVITDFALQIPDVTFPLNLSGGASKYQKKKLDFGFLEIAIEAEVIQREVRAISAKLPELDDVKLHFRPGHLEVQARLRGPERTPVTFKVAFDGDGERLAVYFYDIRLYSFSTTPAARLGAIISEAVRELGALPEVERRGASGFTTRVLPELVEQAAVGRGYKMPALDQARLAEATVSSKGLRLKFSSGGLPPPGAPDEELLLALEGARAFADAEELLAQNKLAQAREAYLRLGDATEAHPFAVERLLTLLVADLQAHELVLDIAASLQRRRERSATALWAEAVVRERRGEFARASERFLALCSLARKNQEEAGAFFSAEAAARSSRDHSPQMAVKALHELLGLKPDHLPSLKALARASDQAKDRAGAIRAYRRLAALARDPVDAAEAHVQLARLCAETEDDLAGARLHCEAALRLSPDHPEALFQLGELCYRSGEWLRAIKALDRVREVAMSRHEVDRVGRANVLAGLVWETGLKQPENALLRFHEATALLPGEPEPHFLSARVAESLGKLQEAVAGYQQAVELAGPAPRTDAIRKAAHSSHHALARLLKTKLGEPARARDHLESALALDPQDVLALDELLPYFRASGKAAELADACEKAAAVLEEPARRAALWAEAGELYRGRLNQPDKAERLLSQALEADGKNRQALEGMLALAESKRDGGQLCRCLKALAELAEDPKERVRHYRRLIVAARDLAFDLEAAVHAAREVLRVEPDDLPVLGELTALERRRSDMAGLAWALEQRARVGENAGDKRLAAAALRELSQVLDQRLGRAGESLVALEKSTRLFPDVNGLLELATLSLRLERPLNARRALEDVLALLPRHAPPEKLAEVRARLGRACEQLGDKDAARENYALAFPLRRLDDELAARLEALYVENRATRELTDLWAARAQALLQAGRAHDAAPLFLKAAQTLLEAGDAQGAILRLTAALDAAPTGEKAGEALEAMAKLELDRGASQEAARLYGRRAMLASEPREAARWFFRAATLTKDTPREQAFLAQSLEKDATFIPARLRRAELIEVTNPREALADFEVVLSAGGELQDDEVAALQLDLAALTRRAALAAQKAGHYDAARRLFARYVAHKPDDLEALQELARLHRRAGALEPLVDLLGDLWTRLQGEARVATRREFTEGALSLGRTAAALEALRAMLADEPTDEWAASRLLTLLPNDDVHQPERLDLLSRLIVHAEGQPRAELLSRRAELHRVAGDLLSARADLLEASQLSANPVPLLRALAELSRQSKDEAAELSALKLVLEHARADETVVTEAAERLITIARNRAHANDNARALEAFEALVTLPLPANERFEAHYGLAQVARSAGNIRRAEEALFEASKQGPVARRVEALLERAALEEGRSAQQAAVDSYGAALELSPRNQKATAGLIGALRRVEDWQGLSEVLTVEAAHLPGPQSVPLWIELASLHLDRLKAPGPGEAALRRVVTLDETNEAARRRLAGLLAVRGERVEAIELLEAAAEHLAPAEAAATLREAAHLAQEEDDRALELRLMRLAHALVPAKGDDLQRLAEALYLQGAVREALPLQQALAGSISFHDAPDVAERIWLRLADLGEQVEDEALAESSLRRVVTERPLNGQAVERLAALVAARDPRAGFELRARWAETLSKSSRTGELLLELAREANAVHHDVETSTRLYVKAADAAESPLPVRLEAAAVLRAAGRTAELMTELAEIAQLQLTEGDFDGALTAWDEEARLAEGSGRIDDALRTLSAMADVCSEEGRLADAGRHLVRRAELLAEAKLDLGGAAQALDRAWEYAPSLSLARQGLALSRRRSDREAEIDWLERVLALLTGLEQAIAFVQLARLHLGLPAEGGADVTSAPLLAPDQAEASLLEALSLAPGLAEAEQMLLGLYERQDRLGDVAAYYEAASTRATDPKQRAELLLRAAQLYKDRAGRPHDAAAALLAARSASPDDLSLTRRVADLLIELGRRQDAADFDGLLIASDPFHSSFERHAEWLEESGDDLSLAGVLSLRAEATKGEEAGPMWLKAAAAFRRAGALERAQVCEAQAFEAAPGNLEAFQSLLERAEGEPRRQAELLAVRARAVPAEASSLLRRRAQLLTTSGEALYAAAAWDEYLQQIPDDVVALEARGTLAADAGGARAAQPFDRRLVQLTGDSLPEATRLAVWTRLGRAAVESQAWHDAVDAFEAAFTIDPTSERGTEALSMLNEAYGRIGDAAGQYRTTMRLAARSTGEEAEALHRRALSLEPVPEKAIAALEWLLARHPGDAGLYEKGLTAYRALGQVGEVVSLHERFAAASGGSTAAKALLAAATLVETELHEGQRAFELRKAAYEADPTDLEAAEAVLSEARSRGDVDRLELMLVRISLATQDEQRAAELKLELAASLESRQQYEAARAPLESIRRAGAGAPGYSQALVGLERIAIGLSDAAALADVQLASAELLGTQERAARLLEAARSFREAKQLARAIALTRESLGARPSKAGFTLLVDLAKEDGRPDELARALTQLAEQGEGVERAVLLLQALDSWRAAGELAEARELLERVLRETPGVVNATDAGRRFLELEAPKRALEVAFGPALRAGRLDEALALAEAANDEAKIREVLAVQASAAPASAAAERYLTILRTAKDAGALRAFATAIAAPAPELATTLRVELAIDFRDVEQVEGLVTAGATDLLAGRALETRAAGVLVALLPYLGSLTVARREAVFEQVGVLVPARRASMMRELATLRTEAGRFQDAVDTLVALAALEQRQGARAVLHIERATLLLRQLNEPELARAAFERALLDDSTQLAAVRELVALYLDGEPERFTSMVERLAEMAGPEAIVRWREPLAKGYEAQGRLKEAYALLGQLPEEPARIRHRVRLAEQLGLQGEAFALAEKVADSREEFERILEGYLRSELVPFAVRLAEKLLAEAPLPAALLRLLAERLAPTQQGASLAVRAWPALLEADVTEVDGWTLFGEALRLCGREEAAVLADGFGAALSSTSGAAPAIQPRKFEWALGSAAQPESCVAVTEDSMPRLFASLTGTLAGFGASELAVGLDVQGGVEAWLSSRNLVLGAGALTVFGQAELPGLVAMALALGEGGVALRGMGEVPGYTEAAVRAFAAYPASLAFCRVLAQLDDSTRGGDPARVDVGAVLKKSAAFRAVALAALESLA
ncbi:MAG: flagellar hook-length control protein FliK [Archangium sp.]|nr:flagellar hook-length control protein FliK [Archangium sp.]